MSDQAPKFEANDIAAAFGLLSRLPVRVDHERAGIRGAGAAWAYPIVGLVISAGAGVIGWALGWAGIPTGMVAVFVLGAMIVATGALHEDGLADFTDGIWGGATSTRRLEIMKDSRIGAYGAVALVLALLARFAGIGELQGWDLVAQLGAIGAASRVAMVFVMFLLDPVRTGGMSASAGQPSPETVGVALIIGLSACVLLTGWSGIFLFGVVLLSALPIGMLAQRFLGGQTGDVLGATQQSAEIVGLAAAIALL